MRALDCDPDRNVIDSNLAPAQAVMTISRYLRWRSFTPYQPHTAGILSLLSRILDLEEIRVNVVQGRTGKNVKIFLV